MLDLEMNEDREMELFRELAKQIVYEYDLDDDKLEYATDLIADWAVDSQSRNGLVMQVAATQEFGAKMSDYTIAQAAKYNINMSVDYEVARKVLRYARSCTSGYPITVYRATDYDGNNALESWTEDRDVAEFYIQRNGGGKVVEMTTDSYIRCSGFGLECAKEIVVINGETK